MSEIAEVLEKAAALIEPEGAWTQESYARDKRGEGLIDGNDPDAVCWCVEGAFDKALDDRYGFLSPAADFFSKFVGGAVAFNDAPVRTQAEVVAALRAAAAKARETGK